MEVQVTDEQQIRQTVADWMAATKAGDIERVLSLMTEDAIFLTAGNPPMNKIEFAKASKSQASSGMDIDGRSDIKEVEVCGDWAYIWSHLSVHVTPPQGKPVMRLGHTLTVFRRQQNRWLLARDANLLGPASK
jgi:uncharacterized protein (TIGR02246 family)